MNSACEPTTSPGDRLIPPVLFAHFHLCIKHIESIPQLFPDSTHHLWILHTTSGKKVLKCLRKKALSQPFWRGMHSLFGLSLTEHLVDAIEISHQLNQYSGLVVAQIEQAHNPTITRPGYALSKLLPGHRLHADKVTNLMVADLAQHLADLHLQTRARWGRFNHLAWDLTEWGAALKQSLQQQLQHLNIDHQAWCEVLNAAEKIRPQAAVPLMMDLRWDQFLTDGEHLTALVDLDAFVFAPRELDLVMLEYLLTDHQAWLFKQLYQQKHDWPDLSVLRAPYRLWLFSLNVLGATDIDVWMDAPTRFD